MFGKRHSSHHAFFTCEADAYELPPPTYLASPMANSRIQPLASKKGDEKVSTTIGIRQGYAMCAVLRAMNTAQESYKSRYCRSEEISGGVKRLTDLNADQVAADVYGKNGPASR